MATTSTPQPERDDYDNPWKDILERDFKEFLEFFFPKAHAGIDWSKPYKNEIIRKNSWDSPDRRIFHESEGQRTFL